MESGSLQFCIANCESADWPIIIDPIALAAVIVLTTVMVFGVRESFWVNMITVFICAASILFCIFAGAPQVGAPPCPGGGTAAPETPPR